MIKYKDHLLGQILLKGLIFPLILVLWILISYPGCTRRIWIFKERPYFWLPNFTASPGAVRAVLNAEASGQVLVVLRILRVWRLEYIKRLFCVPVLAVGHPATGLHVRLIDAPKCQLLLEQRAAHIRWAVKLASPVVVQHICEYARVSIKKEFAGGGRLPHVCVRVHLVVRVGEPGESRTRYGPKGAPVGFVARAADVDYDFVRVFASGHLFLQTWFGRRFIARLAPAVRRNTHRADHRFRWRGFYLVTLLAF